jgi:hypothetical protein
VLDELNMSELLLLAQDNEPNAHRGLGREVLKQLALDEGAAVPVRHIDKVRLKIMTFIDDNFVQVGPLVQGCPAKTRDLRACFQCTDIQAMDCALGNPIIFGTNNSKKE